MSESTAYQYFSRLKDFEKFIANGYGNLSVDNLLLRMKKGKENAYNLLNSYDVYLRNRNISAYIKATYCNTKELFLNIVILT